MQYFQTTDLTPDQLKERIHAADSQAGLIQQFFNKNPTGRYTASDIEKVMKDSGLLSQQVPITSIRRAMSVLQKDGRINKLQEQKIGKYHVPEHYYQLSTGWGKAGYNEEHPEQI